MKVWKKVIPVSMATLRDSREWWRSKNVVSEVKEIPIEIEVEPGKGIAAMSWFF